LHGGQRLLGATGHDDLGTLREDFSHDLAHVGCIVDDQHPDALQPRAIGEPQSGTGHLSPRSVSVANQL
jgi:hypothetical protein